MVLLPGGGDHRIIDNKINVLWESHSKAPLGDIGFAASFRNQHEGVMLHLGMRQLHV